MTSSGHGAPEGGARLRVAVLALEWPSTDRHSGGVGRYTKRLCEWLSAHVDLTVVTGPAPEPMDGSGRLLVADVAGFAGRFSRYYVRPVRAARLVAEIEPDIVHSHGDDWPVVFSRREHPPVLRTYHGRSASEARSGPLLRRANHVVMAAVENLSRSRYAVAVGVGPESTEAFRCHRLIPPVFGLGAGGPVVKAPEPMAAFVGGFHSRKRGELALHAAREARRRLPTMRFAVVGPAADRCHYPDWVEFHEELDDAAVRELIGQAWVLLAPSSYEGFGIPAWEAMALETAVLATRNPGIEFLSSGQSCLVVDDGRLGSELVGLLEQHDARAAQATRGLARAMEVAEMGRPERYLELYRAMAGRVTPLPGTARVNP
ncbi:MAG TPA: glycosyltransferase family 4 protein [Acidimicrobiales bacterium]|nr:glycosyltransferase family 4 protein [Acidimicrobiales bacterium]